MDDGVVWNGVVWNGVVWNGVVWYGVVWSGMAHYHSLPLTTTHYHSLPLTTTMRVGKQLWRKEGIKGQGIQNVF